MEQATNTAVAADTVAQVEHLNATYGEGEKTAPSVAGDAAVIGAGGGNYSINIASSGEIKGFTLRAGTFISPSVGRKVWYRPSAWDLTGPGGMSHWGDAPLDATIVAVHSDRCINVVVFDQMGNQHKRLSVTLLQGCDEPVQGAAYAEWMPYQKQRSA